MSAVERHHAEAALLGIVRRLGEFEDGSLQIIVVHGADGDPVVLPLHQAVHITLPLGHDEGVLAGVVQLHAAHRAVAGDGQGGIHQHGLAPLVVAPELEGMAVPAEGIHHEVAHADGAESADGLGLVEGDGLRRQKVLAGEIGVILGGGEDPVAERLPRKADGLKQQPVLHFIHSDTVLSIIQNAA